MLSYTRTKTRSVFWSERRASSLQAFQGKNRFYVLPAQRKMPPSPCMKTYTLHSVKKEENSACAQFSSYTNPGFMPYSFVISLHYTAKYPLQQCFCNLTRDPSSSSGCTASHSSISYFSIFLYNVLLVMPRISAAFEIVPLSWSAWTMVLFSTSCRSSEVPALRSYGASS